MPFLNVYKGRKVSKGVKGHKLTPKMVEFVDEYMVDLNATQAVKRTSYKTTNPARHAAELMAHPLVKAEIAARLDRKSQKVEVRAEYLVNKLMEIVEQTQTENPQAALRGIELLGKTIAIWKERQEISGPNGEAIKHEQHIKESVADFTNRLTKLAERTTGTDNVIPFKPQE